MTSIRIKKGLDISIEGKASATLKNALLPEHIAIIPDHYPITPKLSVALGDKVKAGTKILHDKNNPEIVVCSPVSGEVTAINRGARRKILEIIISCDKEISYLPFEKLSPSTANADTIIKTILAGGLWPFIQQRPYGSLANPSVTPKAIFISTYDTAPLAPSFEQIVQGEEGEFQAGLDALSKLTTGKLYVGVDAKSNTFNQLQSVEIVQLDGPHPVGNPSVMMNRISPLNKGEIAWTLSPLAVLFIGRLLTNGILNLSKKVALTGPEVENAHFYQSIVGADIELIVRGNVHKGKHLRYISGNVLSGQKIEADGYLLPLHNQITVIAEGDETHEFLGWAMPRLSNFSVNRTYFSWLFKNKAKFDARILGGQRAMIMSGEYDKVFPFDILPEYLIKAMIAKDIDKMEALGVYELVPEDFALCEYVCTSKLEIQQIAKEAMEYMRGELE